MPGSARRIEKVLTEIADKARHDWFIDHFVGWGKVRWGGFGNLQFARGMGHKAVEEAREAGWQVPPKKEKKYRIDRTTLGQLLVEIPDGEESVEGGAQ